MKNETIRAFIALDFPNEAFSFFSEQERRLKPLFNDARIAWVNPTNIHITLAFLGEINRDAIPKITRCLSDLDEAGPFY
ncbi:MAG TPA: 2'-5' RNA ligase family protein, partial [bacterium]|nr:2'-5' RNA ligase family protein [bacterium]